MTLQHLVHLLALFERNLPIASGFPLLRPVILSFDLFFDVHLNKMLNKLWRYL